MISLQFEIDLAVPVLVEGLKNKDEALKIQAHTRFPCAACAKTRCCRSSSTA